MITVVVIGDAQNNTFSEQINSTHNQQHTTFTTWITTTHIGQNTQQH